MHNRLTYSQYYPTWQIRYYKVPDITLNYGTYTFEGEELSVQRCDTILFSGTGRYDTSDRPYLNMAPYQPEDVQPVGNVFTLTGGHMYVLKNVSFYSGDTYSDKFLRVYNTCTLTVEGNTATLSNYRTSALYYDNVNRSSQRTTGGTVQDYFAPYTEMNTDPTYASVFGNWKMAYRASTSGTILTDSDIAGGVQYSTSISSSEELIGNIACAEIKFTTLTDKGNFPYLRYEVKYNDEENWTKMGVFYLVDKERQDTGVWNYTYRDSCKDLDSNANRYIKLLNAGTDRYYHWSSYPLTETSTSGSITVNVNGAAICSYCSDSSSGIKNALTVNENNELRFTKPMNVIFKESKFNWLQYEGIRETLSKHISGPQGPYEDTYVTISNSLNIEDGKQGNVSLGTVTSRVKVNYQNNPAYRWNEYVLGKYVKFDDDSNIYYACATATSHTEGGLIPDVYLDAPVVPIGYEFYEANYTDYDVPDTLNTLVVSHYDSQGNTYYNFDYYEPISICPLCYYTSPLLVAVNGNVYYSALREIVYDERGVNVIGIKINYSKQYTLGSPSDAYNSYIFYYPDYGWSGNNYYIRSKLPVASTPRALWNSVCNYLEITTDITNLPYEFLDYTLEGEYNEDHNTTYRNILSDIVQMCGGYGYVNVSNTFTIATYKEVDGALLDNTMYSNLTTRHTPIPVYNFFQVNLENQEDYMHYGMGTNIMYISNVLCTTSDKDTFLGSYFPRIAELFEEIDEWYKTEITLDRDYGLKPGDIISVEATYSDGTSETFRTLIISKTITSRGVVLSSLIGG